MVCTAIIFDCLEIHGGHSIRHTLSIGEGFQTIKHSYPPSYPPSNVVAEQSDDDFSVPLSSRGNIVTTVS